MTVVGHGLAINLEEDGVILLAHVEDGVGGDGPDLFAIDGDGDGDVPAGVEVAVGVGDVDLGLEGPGRRVEREARAHDLALAGGAGDCLEADDCGVALVDEEGGQLGDADENADRVDLLEDEQRPAIVAAAGLEVVAGADVALGDHAGVGGLDPAVLDVHAGDALGRPVDGELGLGGLDVNAGAFEVGGRLVARHSASETIALAWSRAAAASSNWR